MTALKFEGSGMQYFKIWIVNILLIILTVGLYTPWAKVRTRRYFYANTTLEGRNFEYHATGKQLFIGYLIALALLISFIVLQSLFPYAGIVFVLAWGLLFPWVIWRSLKFNMRMTSFSNVRMAFAGSLSGAYKTYLRLPLFGGVFIYGLTFVMVMFFIMFKNRVIPDSLLYQISLGVLLLLIWSVLSLFVFANIIKSQTTYPINGFRYGQAAFNTELETKGIAKILFRMGILSLSAFVVIGIVLTGVAIMTSGVDGVLAFIQSMKDISETKPGAENAINSAMFSFLGVLYFFMLAASYMAFAYYHSRKRAYVFSNTLLDEGISFSSTLGARKYAWVTISNLALIIITLGLAFPWARVRTTRMLASHSFVDTRMGLDNYVTQKQAEESALGEQIGEAFDVDVGIGI